jgi:hypothetical protein
MKITTEKSRKPSSRANLQRLVNLGELRVIKKLAGAQDFLLTSLLVPASTLGVGAVTTPAKWPWISEVPAKPVVKKGTPNRSKLSAMQNWSSRPSGRPPAYHLRTALPCHGGLRQFFGHLPWYRVWRSSLAGRSSAVVLTLFQRGFAARPASVSLSGVITPRF